MLMIRRVVPVSKGKGEVTPRRQVVSFVDMESNWQLTVRKLFIIQDILIMNQLAHYLRWIPNIGNSYPSAPLSLDLER
jgi:hypothetical protein